MSKVNPFQLERVLPYLRETRDLLGHVPGAVLAAAAAELGISGRQVRRLLDITPARRIPFQITTDHLVKIKQYQGQVKGAHEDLAAAGAVVVSYETFNRAYVDQVPPAVRAGIKTGDRRAMQKAMVHVRVEVEHRNDAWTADHAQLPVVVIGRRGERLHPWVTVILDECTRTIVAWAIVDSQPNQEVIVATLADALIGREIDGEFVGGRCQRFRSDRGSDWLGEWVTRCLVNLGIHADPSAPRSPHQKGKVERVIQTIQLEFCAPLPWADFGDKGPGTDPIDVPGIDALRPLTLKEFIELFRAWVKWYNTERPHGALGDRVPLEAWSSDTQPIERFSDLDALRHSLLRKTEVRKVDKNGISFGRRLYADAALDLYVGKEVAIGFMEERPERIEVFSLPGYKWVTTATWMPFMTERQRGEITAVRTKHFETVSQVSLAAAFAAAGEILDATDLAERTALDEVAPMAALRGDDADEALDALLDDTDEALDALLDDEVA